MYYIYFLINEKCDKTYVGFTSNMQIRIEEHRKERVKSTKNFGKFKEYTIDKAISIEEARQREIYWKSHSGRKRLKKFINNL